MPVLNPKQETMKRSDLQQLQLERLQAILNRVMRNVDFYQKWFRDANILPQDFRSLDDITMLPLISRKTLVENHPYGMFAVPLREVVRLHPSQTGVGETVVIGHTRNDIHAWTTLKARGFAAAGITDNDMVLVYLDYTLFPGAVVAHYGAEQLGACVTPLYNTPIGDQIEIMRNYRTTVLICNPTRAIHIVRFLHEKRIDPKELFLRKVILVGESWSSKIRRQIQENLMVDVYGNYGVTEICIPGISCECEEMNGLHINEDHFYPEIIDPNTGEVLPMGERGELVITTLTKEAFPLIRYRTGAFTHLSAEPCSCGRTFVKMANVAFRTDDILEVDGVEFIPSEIKNILTRIEDVTSNFRLVIHREDTRDRLEVEVEITPEIFQDKLGALEALRERIEEVIYERIRLKPMIKMVEPRSLTDQERIVDLRNQEQE